VSSVGAMKTKSSSKTPSASPHTRGFPLASAILATAPDTDPTVERLQRWVTGVNSLLGHVQTFLVRAFVPTLKLAVLAAVFVVLAKVAGPHLRRRLRPVKWAALRIVPGAETRYDPTAWLRFYRALYGMAAPAWKRLLFGQPWIGIEYRSRAGRLTARCWYPRELEWLIRTALKTALPNAELIPEPTPTAPQLPAGRSRMTLWRESLYPLAQDDRGALAAIAAALAEAPEGLIQIALQPDVSWERLADRRLRQLSGEPPNRSFLADVAVGVLDFFVELVLPNRTSTAPTSVPKARASFPLPPRGKATSPAWLVEIRVCAWTQTAGEAKYAVHAVASAYRALDGENGLRPKRVRWAARFDRAVAEHGAPGGRLHLVAEELTQVFHLPISTVPMDAARVRLGPDRPLSADGSILCRLEGATGEPARIAQADRRHHMHVLGPTGSGKSTLLLNLALQDIEAGVGVGVLDPKGDLISDLLERIPSHHRDRVVLIDPSQREQPVGLNVLTCPDPNQREVVCDGIVTIFKKTYERFWGPRTDDVLRAALLTLMRDPKATLCEVPLLLLNRAARAQLTAELDDPAGLKLFWAEYEQMAPGQQLQVVGPVLNKLRSFLLRPTLRNILGQSTSTIDFQRIIDNNCILLVSLSKGLLGEDTSQLLGSFIVSRLWQAALTRANRLKVDRPDFNLYLDEFHNYLHLPQSLDDILAESRAYHLNLTLANQHLGQLRDSTQEALDSNARTRVVFQCGQDDARRLARQFNPLTDHQLLSLERFQVAVRLCVDGRTEAPFTGITEAPPPSLGELNTAALARGSLAIYGRSREAVESEIEARLVSVGVRGGFKEMA